MLLVRAKRADGNTDARVVCGRSQIGTLNKKGLGWTEACVHVQHEGEWEWCPLQFKLELKTAGILLPEPHEPIWWQGGDGGGGGVMMEVRQWWRACMSELVVAHIDSPSR